MRIAPAVSARIVRGAANHHKQRTNNATCTKGPCTFHERIYGNCAACPAGCDRAFHASCSFRTSGDRDTRNAVGHCETRAARCSGSAIAASRPGDLSDRAHAI